MLLVLPPESAASPTESGSTQPPLFKEHPNGCPNERPRLLAHLSKFRWAPTPLPGSHPNHQTPGGSWSPRSTNPGAPVTASESWIRWDCGWATGALGNTLKIRPASGDGRVARSEPLSQAARTQGPISGIWYTDVYGIRYFL